MYFNKFPITCLFHIL